MSRFNAKVSVSDGAFGISFVLNGRGLYVSLYVRRMHRIQVLDFPLQSLK